MAQVDTNLSNNNASAVTTVSQPTADFTITKTNTPGVNGDVDQTDDTLNSGDMTTYSITVTNNGPDSVADALVTDSIVEGLTCAASDSVTITGDGVPTGSFTICLLYTSPSPRD